MIHRLDYLGGTSIKLIVFSIEFSHSGTLPPLGGGLLCGVPSLPPEPTPGVTEPPPEPPPGVPEPPAELPEPPPTPLPPFAPEGMPPAPEKLNCTQPTTSSPQAHPLKDSLLLV